MADSIPPIFRSALDDVGAADVPALEGRTPPDPPEIEPERDDDDRHGHHWIAVPLPVFAIYGDGTRVGNGWAGHLLDAWFHLATFVTFSAGLWATWQHLAVIADGMVGLLWLAIALVTATLCISCAVAGATRAIDWWKRRRKAGAS